MTCKRKILCVDDEECNRFALSALLKLSGYVAVSAPEAESAFKIFKDDPDGFSLIITDMCMPVYGDGVVLRKNIGAISKVPVILVSGSDIEKESGLEGVFDGFLPKPLNIDHLFAEVGRLVPQ